ncbi:MAG TPA: DsbA family protein [Candidatus Rubrimentiphilum sp.]|nr:DsbA family protein [Candidatus Rubrimentiphilum sp.]
MAVVELTAYIDVLSSWCYVGDLALQKIEKKYGDRLRVEWKIAQLFDFGPLPYTRDQLTWYYARTAKISGVQMNAAWVDTPEATTLHANVAAEAARTLGVTDMSLVRALNYANVIEGKPLGRREPALDEAARLSGLDRAELDRVMRDPATTERIKRTTAEFENLHLPQRPSYIVRNPTGDLAMLSGIYTFESLDAVIGEMLHASEITEQVGPEPA